MKEKLAGNIGGAATSPVLDALSDATSHLDQVAGELEQLHRLALLGILSAGVAHEINNILTPVIAYAHAALAADSDGRLKSKALRKALHGAENVAAIINGTLGAAAMSDNSSNAKVRASFKCAVDAVGRNPRRDGIDLVNEMPADICARISPVALQQVFMNLLLNSCNAMKGAQGRIEAHASQQGGWIVITFKDTGPGIPESIRDCVFKPFVTKSASPNSAHTTGTGLGLAVCRLLIETASGQIEVTSTNEQGTTFQIKLPASESATSHQNAA